MNKLSLLAAAATLGVAAVAHAAPATYTLEPTHSSAMFEIGHFGTSTNRGRFVKTEGSVTLDPAAQTGKLDVTVYMNSLQTQTDAFTKHLSGEEVFNVAAFPTAHVVADKFTFVGDKLSEVSGTLTLMGKTNPIVLKATNYNCYQNPMIKHDICGGDFDATIVRSQYGVSYGLNYGFPDNVHLVIQVEAVKQ